jgi:hypothetical protein
VQRQPEQIANQFFGGVVDLKYDEGLPIVTDGPYRLDVSNATTPVKTTYTSVAAVVSSGDTIGKS